MTDELADMTELMHTRAEPPKREQRVKMLLDKYPGHIAWATDRGSFSGCRNIVFRYGLVEGLEAEDHARFKEEMKALKQDHDSPADLLNLYFSTRGNLLIVDKQSNATAIDVLVTTQLDAEDLAELQEHQRLNEDHMREWRAKRAQAREEEEAQVAEIKRLAEVGRKTETYNLVERLRKAEEEIIRLRSPNAIST